MYNAVDYTYGGYDHAAELTTPPSYYDGAIVHIIASYRGYFGGM